MGDEMISVKSSREEKQMTKIYEALPEPTMDGYDLRQVLAEMAEAAHSFFRDTADVAVVLEIDRTTAAVIFAADPNAEKKLRRFLTERGTRPVPIGLPTGFIAWVRGLPEENEAAAVRVDAPRENTVLACAESRTGKGTGWFAMIPMKEYADEKSPALYIVHVFNAMGPRRFLDEPPSADELVLVRHPRFQMA
jgi:hypothetical protein